MTSSLSALRHRSHILAKPVVTSLCELMERVSRVYEESADNRDDCCLLVCCNFLSLIVDVFYLFFCLNFFIWKLIYFNFFYKYEIFIKKDKSYFLNNFFFLMMPKLLIINILHNIFSYVLLFNMNSKVRFKSFNLLFLVIREKNYKWQFFLKNILICVSYIISNTK